eukprot:PhM_4_TR14692/c1_g1_i1/m.68313
MAFEGKSCEEERLESSTPCAGVVVTKYFLDLGCGLGAGDGEVVVVEVMGFAVFSQGNTLMRTLACFSDSPFASRANKAVENRCAGVTAAISARLMCVSCTRWISAMRRSMTPSRVFQRPGLKPSSRMPCAIAGDNDARALRRASCAEVFSLKRRRDSPTPRTAKTNEAMSSFVSSADLPGRDQPSGNMATGIKPLTKGSTLRSSDLPQRSGSVDNQYPRSSRARAGLRSSRSSSKCRSMMSEGEGRLWEGETCIVLWAGGSSAVCAVGDGERDTASAGGGAAAMAEVGACASATEGEDVEIGALLGGATSVLEGSGATEGASYSRQPNRGTASALAAMRIGVDVGSSYFTTTMPARDAEMTRT